jgi:Uma2 family endonuclease
VAATSSGITLRDLENATRDGRRIDVIFGRVIEMPPAWPESSRVGVVVAYYLEAFRRQHAPDYVVFGADAGFIVREAPSPDELPVLVSPDASLVQRAKLPTGKPRGFWVLVPDLAVEVNSPSDRWRDIEDKIAAYQEAATPLLWVIDTLSQSATVYAAGQPARTLRNADDVLDGGSVLPGFQVTLGEIFSES